MSFYKVIHDRANILTHLTYFDYLTELSMGLDKSATSHVTLVVGFECDTIHSVCCTRVSFNLGRLSSSIRVPPIKIFVFDEPVPWTKYQEAGMFLEKQFS